MTVAFIPVRGGSKSIPLKNIKMIAGHPLVYWATSAASNCADIDLVYVATDSEQIRNTVEGFGFPNVRVIDRSEASATDTASTESAMLEFAEQYDFDDIVLIQATSPLLTSEDLSRGFELYREEGTDSVLSVVSQKRFIWMSRDGYAFPENYDYNSRPRRQEMDGYLVENGAFYITSKNSLMESKCRISGNIKACEMDEASYFEIDEPDDFIIIEDLLKKRTVNDDTILRGIKMFLTDCDGVLTDGGMYYSENGDELKKFNTRDGLGLRLLKEHGIITGIITGENRELNRRRAEKLGLDELLPGIRDKAAAIAELCKKYGISLNEVAYVGDDLIDLEAIKCVGLGCCTSDSAEIVKEEAAYITQKKGGEGAVREVADMILKYL